MIKKIRTEYLEPGMFVSDFNTPWLFHPFIPNRKKIETVREIEAVLKYGLAEVLIDTSRGKDSPRAVPLQEAERDLARQLAEELQEDAEQEPPAPRVPFAAEFRRAREIYGEAKSAVQCQFQEVTRGRPVDGENAHLTVTEMIESVFRNRDALLSLARLKSFDEYTFHHSLNVAVLSLNLGIHMGILHDELLRLGVGAVLHDLGKVRVPGELIQKGGPLAPREYETVKTHAAHGAKILLEARSVPPDCANVPLSHHERYDGTGYPRRISGVKVGKFGLITAIADVYDAMTSHRPYQRGMPATRALRKIYGWAGTHFHPIYVRRFIQCVGIYPIGTAVRLDTGEEGVVMRQNRDDLVRPWVRILREPHGRPLLHPWDADLRAPDPQGETPYARTVTRVLDPELSGLDVDATLAHEPERARAAG